MDFLDPKKFRRNQITLLVGYCLIAIAIAFGTLILLYQTNGFSVTSKGEVIQNGLVFVSSQPDGAQIYLNNTHYRSATNTRLVLPSGKYDLRVTAPGYRDWTRQIAVDGGDVQHFDYPFLFPTTLSGVSRADYTAAPVFTAQSPDRRWIVVKTANDTGEFLVYDLKDPTKVSGVSVVLPTTAYTAGTGAQVWTNVEWASDNRHLLLKHDYTDAAVTKTEYVMFDRTAAASASNVTRTFGLGESESATLFDKKIDRVYAFDATAKTLRTVAEDGSTLQNLEDVVAYKSYGDDTMLYVTTVPLTGKAAEGTVSVVLRQGSKTYTLRQLPANATVYSLDIARYSGDWYVVVAANNDSGVYIYRNPQSQPAGTLTGSLPAVWRRLSLKNPAHVSFSSTAQFILAQTGQDFWIYDAENLRTHRYTTTQSMDQPQRSAEWMDGYHLTYVSGGKQIVFDYDYQNLQTLQSALPAYLPAFAPNYQYVYNIAPGNTAEVPAALIATPLRTEE